MVVVVVVVVVVLCIGGSVGVVDCGYMSLKHALMTYRGGFNDILYVMVICHGEI